MNVFAFLFDVIGVFGGLFSAELGLHAYMPYTAAPSCNWHGGGAYD